MQPASAAHRAEADAAAATRILVVDDSEDNVESLAGLLRVMGHEVRTARDGVEAVRAASEYLPRVVFLDIGMPNMDGYAAARRIRAHAWGRKMALIAMTGWGKDEDKRRSAAAGFDSHLVKPVDPAELDRILAGIHDRG